MDNLKWLVRRIRLLSADSKNSGGLMTLREAADEAERLGYKQLNLKFWRQVVSTGSFPGVIVANRWQIRRDHFRSLLTVLSEKAF